MTPRKLTQNDWNLILPTRIGQVYSGKQGCMCGCLGKYWSAGKMVNKVLNILKADSRTMLQDGYIVYIDFKSRARDERNYVLYLKEPLAIEVTQG